MAWLKLFLLVSLNAYAVDVIYIGDSHSSGCFGKKIDQALRTTKDPATKHPLKVRSEATCGSKAASWIREKAYSTKCGFRSCNASGKCISTDAGQGGPLSKLLSDSGKTRITVVALGTNMISDRSGPLTKSVGQMISQIKAAGSKCIWIGPPQVATFVAAESVFNDYVKELKKVVEGGGCSFVPSDDLTSRDKIRDTEGLNYACSDAEDWASKVSERLLPLVATQLNPSTTAEK